METFNSIEICSKYTDRLAKDIAKAGQSIFGGGVDDGSIVAGGRISGNGIEKSGAVGVGVGRGKSSSSMEMDKLKLCQEDFSSAKVAFQQVLATGAEQLVSQVQSSLKDIITFTLGRNGLLGGIKFDMADDTFDSQPSVSVLPKALLTPLETLTNICTSNMTDCNKDLVVGLLANSCCEKIEQFIYQVNR